MSEGTVTLEIDGALAVVTLDRPTKANALDLAMLEALEARLADVELLPDMRVVLLTGAGKAFSAGGDIKAWSGMDPAAFAHLWVRAGHRVFDRLARLRVPVIAVLDGPALGGGFELASACDFRVAEEQIRIGLPEASLGVVPGWSGTQRAVRRFGAQIVRRLALGGDVLSATDALAAGLVDRVVPTGAGMAAARDWAAAIATRGPEATAAVKLMLAAAEGEEHAASVEALASAYITTTAGLREGITAFMEKRAPQFSAASGEPT